MSESSVKANKIGRKQSMTYRHILVDDPKPRVQRITLNLRGAGSSSPRATTSRPIRRARQLAAIIKSARIATDGGMPDVLPQRLESFWYFSDAYAAESPGLRDLPTSDVIASGGGPHHRSEPRLHSAHSRGGYPVDRASRQGLAFPTEPVLERPPEVMW